ncbi:ATPase AAA [Tenacibaculum maritimum]|uniref:AAA family ATPase n=1 Tax=Tenacibaculum maritimum TaxID=107401 RepID=UPI0012E6BEE4|nr:AAA family ATPase [Tenacibaculum maritimum]CAA0143754.1 ATPase AAA [Tenacibaculum maritimum]CAA0144407.1 ATPase AAA [Tenacibaculum maritimum]CAA0205949.1 ATPase AAA [Tenacibaculum maritimum]CAA0248147.1 ATPase AAA [Tenacibaculum maritimum]
MQLKQSKRQNVKLRLGISGASGFGKTHSALLLAYGMTQDWTKIAVIDTENSSASLYSDLGEFNVLDLQAPYSPERYTQAIEVCEKAGIEVCIIDSLSSEWQGTGGCLQIHEQLGGRFQDWAPVKKRHQALIDKILHSTCHIITTTRRKIDYSLDIGSNGRTKVVKHGTKEITREGFEYELTVNFELVNDQHLAKASKDRTGLFMNKPEFIITSKTGERLLKWCNSKPISIKEVIDQINSCLSISELSNIYNKYSDFQQKLEPQFRSKKQQLEQLTNHKNFSSNGASSHLAH